MADAKSLAPGRRIVGSVHAKLIFSRRVEVLASVLSSMLPAQGRVLDVGAGSGDIASAILQLRPSLRIEGVDVLVREDTKIPVRQFDGKTLPYGSNEFDAAMLVDVLHHTDGPAAVLTEVGRVARYVIIKDHYRSGFMAAERLRLMDWVGNAPHGVHLPYNYLSHDEWAHLWSSEGFEIDRIVDDLNLYAPPLNWAFGRGLHFVARVKSPERHTGTISENSLASRSV